SSINQDGALIKVAGADEPSDTTGGAADGCAVAVCGCMGAGCSATGAVLGAEGGVARLAFCGLSSSKSPVSQSGRSPVGGLLAKLGVVMAIVGASRTSLAGIWDESACGLPVKEEASGTGEF